jgi:hypothetical protein
MSSITRSGVVTVDIFHAGNYLRTYNQERLWYLRAFIWHEMWLDTNAAVLVDHRYSIHLKHIDE